MRKRLTLLMVLGLVLSGFGVGPAGAADPSLVGWWPLDDGSGTIAAEASGKSVDGTLFGNPVWSPDGVINGCLRFDGTDDYVFIDGRFKLATYTMGVWFRDDSPGQRDILSAYAPTVLHGILLEVGTDGRLRFLHRFPLGTGGGSNVYSTATYADAAWHHAALTKSPTEIVLYVDGKEVGKVADTSVFDPTDYFGLALGCLDNERGLARMFLGAMDDVQIYNRALSAAEVLKIMAGLADKALAENVSPADGATDVPRDTTLNWRAGQYAGTHDVYFGVARNDVNNATRTDTTGLLAGKGQVDNTFDPSGLLAYGQTYYWRIDEVNQTPDNTIFKGSVWSFTVEPYAYPVKPVQATASSAQANMGPEKTIDGSGMTGDQAGTAANTMWVSKGVPPNWIQYEFDAADRIHEMRVWNSNQSVEPFVGFGAKDVTVEYSTDGTAWTALAGVPAFGQGTGLPTYTANTVVNFGGALAQYVKLTINKNWNGAIPTTGLSEVRFSQIPVQARAPQPATAATGVPVDTKLDWRPGREAKSHTVLLSTDQAAVAAGTAPAQTVADHGFDPGALSFGTTYYWKVDEVNTVTYPGPVWSFTTQQYAVVDDFESYTDDEGSRIYETWIDGWTNGTGSIVGYIQAPFAEQKIVHSGRQSMPVEYNNVKTPYYSEAQRTFDTPLNWTTSGADTLALYFRGRAPAFADKGNNAFTVSASGTDIWNNGDQFRFVYKSLNGNGTITVRVDSIGNTNVWAKAGPMIRDNFDAGARNACIVVTPGSGVSFQWRDTTNGASASSATTGLVAPHWVRLTRTGNIFKAERSADGKTWTQQGVDTTIPMGANVYVGLAVTSHDALLTTTAEISNVATTGTVTGSWQVMALGAAMPTNSPAPLYVAVEDKAGKSKTVVHPDAAAATLAAWTEWRIPLSDLSAGGVNLAAVKKITIGLGDKASPKPGAAGLMYLDDIGFGHPSK
ncbi:MAG: discoidin domain-containing protein [Planctomycetes bacterium]|nr:discoidin domain-containing protein [Planctomycetota bacterium]